MKQKSFSFKAVIAAMMMVFFAFSANAQSYDCSDAAIKLSDTMNKLSEAINKCKTMADVDQVMNNFDVKGVPNECMDNVLTSGDKVKLKAAGSSMCDAMVDAVVKELGGQMDRETVKGLMLPMLEVFLNAADNATTLGDYVNTISNAFTNM